MKLDITNLNRSSLSFLCRIIFSLLFQVSTSDNSLTDDFTLEIKLYMNHTYRRIKVLAVPVTSVDNNRNNILNSFSSSHLEEVSDYVPTFPLKIRPKWRVRVAP